MAKRIHQASIIGQEGAALIEQVTLRMGFVWHPRGQLDAGIDGSIEIRDTATGSMTNYLILVQSKAGDSYFKAETASGFEFLCDERDLRYWLQGNVPVILVVSRPETSEAYWIPIKEYFRDLDRLKSRKIYFNKQAHRFDEQCKPHLMELAIPQSQGIYFAPARKHERLFTNLLTVSHFADKVYLAQTEYRSREDVVAEVKKHWEDFILPEWILKNKNILSFHDLEQPPWNHICDTGSIEVFDSAEWADTEDADKRWEFVDLLKRSLQEKVWRNLRYDAKNGYFYFKATPKLASRSYAYTSPSGNKTDRLVFHGYENKNTPGQIIYYRHSAFSPFFKRYDRVWYLEITPTYHYTLDGEKRFPGSADQLSGIKRLEQNPAVLGQVMMWSHFLTRPPTLFEAAYPFLTFGELMTFETEVGIDDDTWRKREDEDTEVIEAEDFGQMRLL